MEHHDEMPGGRMPGRQSPGADAVSEAMCLYHAWLGYLLTRLGEKEVRVPAAALSRALGRLSCRVRRDGGDYVISFADNGEGDAGGGHGRSGGQ